MQKRCDRNRKRSKRRSIYCPKHECYLHSVSQKFPLYADQVEQLRQRGMGQLQARLSISTRSTVPLTGEWLEAFWCDDCQTTEWYHVHRRESNYEVAIAPPELWQQAVGVVHPNGNPSVSEFTRNQSRMGHHPAVKDFRAIG